MIIKSMIVNVYSTGHWRHLHTDVTSGQCYKAFTVVSYEFLK
jgi:hypothetical protein